MNEDTQEVLYKQKVLKDSTTDGRPLRGLLLTEDPLEVFKDRRPSRELLETEGP